jgi:hypothetical protein
MPHLLRAETRIYSHEKNSRPENQDVAQHRHVSASWIISARPAKRAAVAQVATGISFFVSFFVSSRPESAEWRDPGFRPRALASPLRRSRRIIFDASAENPFEIPSCSFFVSLQPKSPSSCHPERSPRSRRRPRLPAAPPGHLHFRKEPP